MVGVHLQHGQVVAVVVAHQRRLQRGVVLQDDADLVGTFDHVVVGHDDAGAVDDEAGAQRLQAMRLAVRAGLALVLPLVWRVLARVAVVVTTAVIATMRVGAVHEVLEELLERRARREGRHLRPLVAGGRLHVLRGADVDHGRQQAFSQVREAVRRAARERAGRKAEGGGQGQRGGKAHRGGYPYDQAVWSWPASTSKWALRICWKASARKHMTEPERIVPEKETNSANFYVFALALAS